MKSWFSGPNGSSATISVLDDERELDALLRRQLNALNRVQAVIRFSPDGVILDANDNFLKTMGYRLEEIKGKHHSMFVDPEYANSQEYGEFWKSLRRGEFHKEEFKRIGKGGVEVWLLASYNPIFDAGGQQFGVVKFAADVTADKLKSADYQGQMEAIRRTQATIEFDLDGRILTANPLFLNLMGYSLGEVQGKHHSMFMEAGEESKPAYHEFWQRLRAGQPDTKVFKRIAKNGCKVWIQGSYNPILDMNGKPFKVVKFAFDLTQLVTHTEMTQVTAQNVATATEEMSSSIDEISRNLEQSRMATDRIMSCSTESGMVAGRLIESMASMEKIVGLIRSIAGRVNMLALNAAIEAARAGEAGKGFAVVANEVKNLSDQTAQATNQIDKEIGAVQAISSKVAAAIKETLDGVTHVKGYVDGVATAMVEQNSATREISEHSARLVTAVEEILDRTLKGAA